jgi:hypothetical protein
MRRPARDSEAVGDMDEAGFEPALTDDPRPSARTEVRARCGEELANVADVLGMLPGRAVRPSESSHRRDELAYSRTYFPRAVIPTCGQRRGEEVPCSRN